MVWGSDPYRETPQRIARMRDTPRGALSVCLPFALVALAASVVRAIAPDVGPGGVGILATMSLAFPSLLIALGLMASARHEAHAAHAAGRAIGIFLLNAACVGMYALSLQFAAVMVKSTVASAEGTSMHALAFYSSLFIAFIS